MVVHGDEKKVAVRQLTQYLVIPVVYIPEPSVTFRVFRHTGIAYLAAQYLGDFQTTSGGQSLTSERLQLVRKCKVLG